MERKCILLAMINGYDMSTVESQRYAGILCCNEYHFALGKLYHIWVDSDASAELRPAVEWVMWREKDLHTIHSLPKLHTRACETGLGHRIFLALLLFYSRLEESLS
jgi:hypothetical protein